MPTRTNYQVEPAYASAWESTFGGQPPRPIFELYIPEQFRSVDLHHSVQRPIWELETNVIWPYMGQLLQASNVVGDLVEFGVYTGHSFGRHIEAFRPLGVINRFYGFDSFQGLPAPEPGQDHPSYYQAGQFSDTSKAGVTEYLHQKVGGLANVELVEGWFNETLPTVSDRIQSVAFARIDCDLYSSSKVVFDFLAGRLVDGAILYFDDWTHEADTGETKAFFEFAQQESGRYAFEHILTVSDGAVAVRVTHVKA
jgi:hypothetical protein